MMRRVLKWFTDLDDHVLAAGAIVLVLGVILVAKSCDDSPARTCVEWQATRSTIGNPTRICVCYQGEACDR